MKQLLVDRKKCLLALTKKKTKGLSRLIVFLKCEIEMRTNLRNHFGQLFF